MKVFFLAETEIDANCQLTERLGNFLGHNIRCFNLTSLKSQLLVAVGNIILLHLIRHVVYAFNKYLLANIDAKKRQALTFVSIIPIMGVANYICFTKILKLPLGGGKIAVISIFTCFIYLSTLVVKSNPKDLNHHNNSEN